MAPETRVRLTGQFAADLPELSAPAVAAPTPDPGTVIVNSELAIDLGLDPPWLESPDGAVFLTGNGGPAVLQHPVAQRYSGHQFGGFSPLLGDGRAMLLGEIRDTTGNLRDLHLKGSGPSSFSRGDGMATLEATLREYLMSEAMHALGIPTTRALAVATTGRHLARDNFRHDNVLPGSVLSRVATSHVRVGTFQYARITGDEDLMRRLLSHTINRTDPDLAGHLEHDTQRAARELLTRVIARQASLVAKWMLVGFVHGVMNTDNVLVSGETIDYGPCAFLDTYAPDTVFSSIDHAGRYAFGAQPGIMKWNVARFADALLPLIAEDEPEAIRLAESALETFDGVFADRWEAGMRDKLGLRGAAYGGPSREHMSDITEALFTHMHAESLDFTLTFRELMGERPPMPGTWVAEWRGLGPDPQTMALVNPVTIARNQHLQDALDRAVEGDTGPYRELLQAVCDPLSQRPEWAKFATPGPIPRAPFVTYCGT